MPKPMLGDVASSIIDPMMSDNFLLEIASVPMGAGGYGDSRPLILQCRTATKPGVTIESVEVALFGHTLEYVGRKTFSHDMTVEYVENRSAQIQTLLEGWAEYCRATQTQHGNYKADYAKDAILTIFDVKGMVAKKYTIVNIWPSAVPEVSFDGQAANLITLSVTFKYDWYEEVGGTGSF